MDKLRLLAKVAEAAAEYRLEEMNSTPRMVRGKKLQDLAKKLDGALANLVPPT